MDIKRTTRPATLDDFCRGARLIWGRDTYVLVREYAPGKWMCDHLEDSRYVGGACVHQSEVNHYCVETRI